MRGKISPCPGSFCLQLPCQNLAQELDKLSKSKFMTAYNLPELGTVSPGTSPAIDQIQRAEEIMNVLIQQTAQAEYDDITVDRLITEYYSLMA